MGSDSLASGFKKKLGEESGYPGKKGIWIVGGGGLQLVSFKLKRGWEGETGGPPSNCKSSREFSGPIEEEGKIMIFHCRNSRDLREGSGSKSTRRVRRTSGAGEDAGISGVRPGGRRGCVHDIVKSRC